MPPHNSYIRPTYVQNEEEIMSEFFWHVIFAPRCFMASLFWAYVGQIYKLCAGCVVPPLFPVLPLISSTGMIDGWSGVSQMLTGQAN